MYKVNDYELIYLIQEEKHETVLAYMIAKYERFIWKTIHTLHVPRIEHEDFFQEAIILMVHTVYHFKEYKNKTFMRYFELILRRRYYYLFDKLPKYILHETLEGYNMSSNDEQSLETEDLTVLEKNVFQAYFVENQNIKTIAKAHGLTSKQVYNAIYRIKEKYKNML